MLGAGGLYTKSVHPLPPYLHFSVSVSGIDYLSTLTYVLVQSDVEEILTKYRDDVHLRPSRRPWVRSVECSEERRKHHLCPDEVLETFIESK